MVPSFGGPGPALGQAPGRSWVVSDGAVVLAARGSRHVVCPADQAVSVAVEDGLDHAGHPATVFGPELDRLLPDLASFALLVGSAEVVAVGALRLTNVGHGGDGDEAGFPAKCKDDLGLAAWGHGLTDCHLDVPKSQSGVDESLLDLCLGCVVPVRHVVIVPRLAQHRLGMRELGQQVLQRGGGFGCHGSVSLCCFA